MALNKKELTKLLIALKKEFGDDFYLELQPHPDYGDQSLVNTGLIKIGKELNIDFTIANDVHYLSKEDKFFHNTIKAIAYHKNVNESGFTGNSFFLMNTDELIEYALKTNIPQDILKQAINNTIKISNKCNAVFPTYGKIVPEFQIEEGFENNTDFLIALCKKGAKEKNIDLSNEVYKERFEKELNVIKDGDLIDYHLIVFDIVKEARKRGILVGPGRGSASGSLINFLLNITQIDPIEHNLIFERYLSKARFKSGSGNADIDIDFMSSRRDEVFDFIKEKYGADCVAQIVNYVTFGVKQGLRDISRSQNIPIAEVNIAAKAIEDGATLEEALEVNEVKMFLNRYPKVALLLPKIIGMIKTRSVHAAGIVICPQPIEEYASIERVNQRNCVCYDKRTLESMNFLKVDCLALKALDIVSKSLELIKEKIILPLKFNDKEVYKIFSNGYTNGIFQFESQLLTNMVKKLQVDNFKELVDATSIIRPGSLRSGDSDRYVKRKLKQETISYQDPSLEPILKDRKGIIIYQEDLMTITNQIGGISLEETEVLRKIVSDSKGSEALDEYKEQFILGAIKNRVSKKNAENIWKSIREAGGYLFNLSHGTSYTALSFQMAWLKNFFPKEFLTSLMYFEEDFKLSEAARELRELGWNVRTPDINESNSHVSILSNGDIIFGLNDIESVGEKAVENIIANRPYFSFNDFMERREARQVNIRVIRNLITAGAFDAFGDRDVLYYSVTPDEKRETWDEKKTLLKQLEVLDIPPKTPIISFYDYPFDTETTNISEIDWETALDEIYVKGVITKINPKKGYTLFNMTGEGGTVNVLAGEEVVNRFSQVFDAGVGNPVLIKAHIVEGKERLYADMIIPFEGYEEYEEELNYINGNSIKRLEYLKEQSRNNVGLVTSSNYFRSKKGNKGSRIVFSDGNRYMDFGKENYPLLAGNIIEYQISQNPFINVINKY